MHLGEPDATLPSRRSYRPLRRPRAGVFWAVPENDRAQSDIVGWCLERVLAIRLVWSVRWQKAAQRRC